MPNPKYYEVLGLTPSASEDEIKRAYKKLALEHHPDRNLGNEKSAQEKFMKIQAAHDALLNPSEHKTSVEDMYTQTPDDVPPPSHAKPHQHRHKATPTKYHDGEPSHKRRTTRTYHHHHEESYGPFQNPHFDIHKPFGHPLFDYHNEHGAQPDFWKKAFEGGFERGGSPFHIPQPHSHSQKDENGVRGKQERSRSRDKTCRKHPPSAYPQKSDSNGANRSFEDAMGGINVRINHVHITVDNRGLPVESSRNNPRKPHSDCVRPRSNTRNHTSPINHGRSESSNGHCRRCGGRLAAVESGHRRKEATCGDCHYHSSRAEFTLVPAKRRV